MQLACAARPWARVRGPATAFVASAAELGWTVQAAACVIDDRGCAIDLGRDSPGLVRQMVAASVRRWRWKRVASRLPSLRRSPACAAFLQPIHRLLDPRNHDTTWTSAQAASLRSLVTDRQWPQQRLHTAGLADDPFCQLCVATSGVRTPGTSVHRICECPCLESVRSRVLTPALRSIGLPSLGALDTVDTAFWTRGMVPLPPVACGRMPPQSFSWVLRPRDGMLGRGTVYTDGSRVGDPRLDLRDTCRYGWSFRWGRRGGFRLRSRA